jgi:DNA-binding response OmpR family regulator
MKIPNLKKNLAKKLSHQREQAPSSSSPHRRVLLLDDDLDLCDVLKTILEWHRYEVTVVHRGVEGVREIMARDYDAIVCDIMMPKMPGDMFYVAVQQLKPHLCRRFIFITGHQDNPKVDAFLKISAGLVLCKPLATDELIVSIGRIIAATDVMVEKIVAAVLPDAPEETRRSSSVVTPKHSLLGEAATSNRIHDPEDRAADIWVG